MLTELTPEALSALQPALAQGMQRHGPLYIAEGHDGAVISEDVGQQLIEIGIAKLEGDRLVLDEG
jgi:hypothetical protein